MNPNDPGIPPPATRRKISFSKSEEASWRKTPMGELPRIHAEELRDPASPYFGGRLPFVLHLNGSGVGSAQTEWSISWLRENFGEQIVDWYPKGMLDIRSKPYLRPFNDVAVDWAALGNDQRWRDRKETPYAQWRLEMGTWRELKKSLGNLPKWFTVDEAWLAQCLPGRTPQEWPADNWLRHCHWKVLVLGKRGSGMFFHADGISTSTYQLQVLGRKRWVVCRPGQASSLYMPGEVDAFDPDMRRFPRFAAADCTRTVAGPGDILYYPTGWWHQTDNLDSDTIGVAARRVDAHNYGDVYQELVRKCAAPTEDISLKWPGAAPPLSRTNCASIATCHGLWAREFKGAPEGVCSAEKAGHGVCSLSKGEF